MNDFFIFEWFYAAIMAAVSTEILLHGHYRGEINNVRGVGQIDFQSEYTESGNSQRRPPLTVLFSHR